MGAPLYRWMVFHGKSHVQMRMMTGGLKLRILQPPSGKYGDLNPPFMELKGMRHMSLWDLKQHIWENHGLRGLSEDQ